MSSNFGGVLNMVRLVMTNISLRGIPENLDHGPQWDPSGVQQKPENWDPGP